MLVLVLVVVLVLAVVLLHILVVVLALVSAVAPTPAPIPRKPRGHHANVLTSAPNIHPPKVWGGMAGAAERAASTRPSTFDGAPPPSIRRGSMSTLCATWLYQVILRTDLLMISCRICTVSRTPFRKLTSMYHNMCFCCGDFVVSGYARIS